MLGLGDEGGIRVEGEGFRPVGEEEIEAGTHPANPKNIKTEVEPFL
jgi:hypothetical protein